MNRLAREQIQNVETYSATWTHPDGAAWKSLGTLVIPAVSGMYVVRSDVRMVKATTKLGFCTLRAMPIAIIVMGGGGITFRLTGAYPFPESYGSVVYEESDLDKTDVIFTPTVVGVDVHVDVSAKYPGLVGGESLLVKAELWWD